MFLRYIWSRSCAVVKPLCCKVCRVKYVLVYLQQSDYKTLYRSSHLRVFWYFQGVKKACNFIKQKTLAQVFSCEFCEISKNTFSYRTPLGDCCHWFIKKETVSPVSLKVFWDMLNELKMSHYFSNPSMFPKTKTKQLIW